METPMSNITEELTGQKTGESMLGSLTSLTGGGGFTGGSSGPSTAGGQTSSNSSSGFTGGVVNMGSNNGLPTWAIVLGILAAVYVFTRK